MRVRVGWPGPTPAYPIGPMRTNHPWRPTAPGPLYRPDACQPPWPTLSGEHVPTAWPALLGGRVAAVLAYPIGPTRTVWACIGRVRSPASSGHRPCHLRAYECFSHFYGPFGDP